MTEALNNDDYTNVKESLDHLKEASYKFAEAIYSKRDQFAERSTENE